MINGQRIFATLILALLTVPFVNASHDHFHYAYWYAEGPMTGTVTLGSEGNTLPEEYELEVSADQITYDHHQKLECEGDHAFYDSFTITGDIVGSGVNTDLSTAMTWTYLGLQWTGTYTPPSVFLDPPAIRTLSASLDGKAIVNQHQLYSLVEEMRALNFHPAIDEIKDDAAGVLGDTVTLTMHWEGSGKLFSYGDVVTAGQCTHDP